MSEHLTFSVNLSTCLGAAGTWTHPADARFELTSLMAVIRYRNFLMACAALMDQQFQAVYFPHLDSPLPPGVRNLQHWLEDAWKHGDITSV